MDYLIDKKGLAQLMATLLIEKKPSHYSSLAFCFLLTFIRLSVLLDKQILSLDYSSQEEYWRNFKGTFLEKGNLTWKLIEMFNINSHLKEFSLGFLSVCLVLFTAWITIMAFTILKYSYFRQMSQIVGEHGAGIPIYFKGFKLFIAHFDLFYLFSMILMVGTSLCTRSPIEVISNQTSNSYVILLDERKESDSSEINSYYSLNLNKTIQCWSVNHFLIISLMIWLFLCSTLIKWVSHLLSKHVPDPNLMGSYFGHSLLFQDFLMMILLTYKGWLRSIENPKSSEIDSFYYLSLFLFFIDTMIVNFKQPFHNPLMNKVRVGQNLILQIVPILVLVIRNTTPDNDWLRTKSKSVIFFSLVYTLLLKMNFNIMKAIFDPSNLEIKNSIGSLQETSKLTFFGLEYVQASLTQRPKKFSELQYLKIQTFFLTLTSGGSLNKMITFKPKKLTDADLLTNRKMSKIFKKKASDSNVPLNNLEAKKPPNIHLKASDNQNESDQNSLTAVNNIENLELNSKEKSTPTDDCVEKKSSGRRGNNKVSFILPSHNQFDSMNSLSYQNSWAKKPAKQPSLNWFSLMPMKKQLTQPSALTDNIRRMKEFMVEKAHQTTPKKVLDLNPLSKYPLLEKHSVSQVLTKVRSMVNESIQYFCSKSVTNSCGVLELMKIDVFLSVKYFGSMASTLSRLALLKEVLLQKRGKKKAEKRTISKKKAPKEPKTPFSVMILEEYIELHLKQNLKSGKMIMRDYRVHINDPEIKSSLKLKLCDCFSFLIQYQKIKSFIIEALKLKTSFLDKMRNTCIADFHYTFETARKFNPLLNKISKQFVLLESLKEGRFNGVEILKAYYRLFLLQDCSRCPLDREGYLKITPMINYANFTLSYQESFSRESVVLGLSGEKSTFHTLNLVTSNVKNVLYYNSKDLQGKDASILMPEPLKQRHKDLLSETYFSGPLLERTSPLVVMALDKRGYLQEAEAFIRLNPDISCGVQYLGCFTFFQKREQKEGLMILNDLHQVTHLNQMAERYFSKNHYIFEYNESFFGIFNDINSLNQHLLSSKVPLDANPSSEKDKPGPKTGNRGPNGRRTISHVEAVSGNKELLDNYQSFYIMNKGHQFQIIDRRGMVRSVVLVINDILIYKIQSVVRCLYFKVGKAEERAEVPNSPISPPAHKLELRHRNMLSSQTVKQTFSAKEFMKNLKYQEFGYRSSEGSFSSESSKTVFSNNFEASNCSLESISNMEQNVLKMLNRVNHEIKDQEHLALMNLVEEKLSSAQVILNNMSTLPEAIQALLKEKSFQEKGDLETPSNFARVSVLSKKCPLIEVTHDAVERAQKRDLARTMLLFIKNNHQKKQSLIFRGIARAKKRFKPHDLQSSIVESVQTQNEFSKMSLTLKSQIKYKFWNLRVLLLILFVGFSAVLQYSLGLFKIELRELVFEEVQYRYSNVDVSTWVVWAFNTFLMSQDFSRAAYEGIIDQNFSRSISNVSVDQISMGYKKSMVNMAFLYSLRIQQSMLNTSSHLIATQQNYRFSQYRVTIYNFTGDLEEARLAKTKEEIDSFWEPVELPYLEALSILTPRFNQLARINNSLGLVPFGEYRLKEMLEENLRRNGANDLLKVILEVCKNLKEYFEHLVNLNALFVKYGDIMKVVVFLITFWGVLGVLLWTKKKMQDFYCQLFAFKVRFGYRRLEMLSWNVKLSKKHKD